MSARRSILELCNLFTTIFDRPVELNSGGKLAVTVVLIADVAYGHARQLPCAPVDAVEVAKQRADAFDRCLHGIAIEHCLIFFLVTLVVGNGDFLGAQLCLFVAQEELFAVFGKVLVTNFFAFGEDGVNATLRYDEQASVLQWLHGGCLEDAQRAVLVLLNYETTLVSEIHSFHLKSAYPCCGRA